jgi:CDP-diacylglycerol--serine O-phosphatidyltransferase
MLHRNAFQILRKDRKYIPIFAPCFKYDTMSIKQHIPNTITCGNLVSGCVSILFVSMDMPVKAALMIFVAGLFDFLDGFAARKLHAHSPIGADLDSLSDVVSSGVAPGFIMYWLMSQYFISRLWLHEWWWSIGGFNLLPFIAFLLPVFSAIRLAKFNVDDTQTTSFRGIPAPGMAIFIASLPLALSQIGHLTDGSLNYWACLGITLFFSFLMVSRIRFFSFKMKSAKWKGNEVRWIFLMVAVAGFVAFRFTALPFIMILYILLSVFFAEKME